MQTKVVIPRTASASIGGPEVRTDFARLGALETPPLQEHEIPTAVLVVKLEGDAHPWRVDNGLLTISGKQSRPALEAKYGTALDGLVANA